MSTITWTHVDKLVRDMHDTEGLLPVGNTDAEITYNFIKFLANVRTKAEREYSSMRASLLVKDEQLMIAEQNRRAKSPKTKERVTTLEKEVERLAAMLDKCPAIPFAIGRCANKHCGSQAREISPYCSKCEPDL